MFFPYRAKAERIIKVVVSRIECVYLTVFLRRSVGSDRGEESSARWPGPIDNEEEEEEAHPLGYLWHNCFK